MKFVAFRELHPCLNNLRNALYSGISPAEASGRAGWQRSIDSFPSTKAHIGRKQSCRGWQEQHFPDSPCACCALPAQKLI